MLTPYDWIYGIANITAVILAIIAAFIAINIYDKTRDTKTLGAWKYLLIALGFFVIQEILGVLKTFGIYSTPHLTHVVPGIILVFLIASLAVQINITRGNY